MQKEESVKPAGNQKVIKVINQKVINQKVINQKVINQKVINQKVINQKVINQKVINQKKINQKDGVKILLVEGNKNVDKKICTYLERDSFYVKPTYTGKEALRSVQEEKFDLILLDIMLPDCNGMEVIQSIRQKSIVPIIIVTSQNNVVDKAMGLNMGADDYVTKPVSISELSARIKANIRRATEYNNRTRAENAIIKIKDLEINISSHTVKREEQELGLTCTEFEILKLLAMTPGRSFSKEEIYTHVWKEPYFYGDNSLNVHMNRLRNKLRLNANNNNAEDYIKTIWRVGYQIPLVEA